jgi:hypothetical protein
VSERFDACEDSGEGLCCFLLSSSQFSQKLIRISLADDFQGLLSTISCHCSQGCLGSLRKDMLPAGFDASGSAGYDCSRGSYAEGSAGYSGEGWSVHVQGDVNRDNSGHTSGGAHVEGSVHW